MLEKSYDNGFRPIGYDKVYTDYRAAQYAFDRVSSDRQRNAAKKRLHTAIKKLASAMQTDTATWEKLN